MNPEKKKFGLIGGLIIAILLAIPLYKIAAPFLMPIFLGAVLAMISRPLYLWLTDILNKRKKSAAAITTLLIVLIVVVIVSGGICFGCWLAKLAWSRAGFSRFLSQDSENWLLSRVKCAFCLGWILLASSLSEKYERRYNALFETMPN